MTRRFKQFVVDVGCGERGGDVDSDDVEDVEHGDESEHERGRKDRKL